MRGPSAASCTLVQEKMGRNPGGLPEVTAGSPGGIEIMADKNSSKATKQRVAAAAELDTDISYSLWRRGSAPHLAEAFVRRPGAMLRG